MVLAGLAGGAAASDFDDMVAAERAFAADAVARTTREAFLAALAPDAVVFDPGPAEGYSLIYMMQNLRATSAGFEGTKFAQAGSEIQNEATAGAAMALWLRGEDAFRNAATRYLDSLVKQMAEAKNADGYGVVATPVPEAKTGEGLGWSYFNFLHVASSAWTGLALLAKDDPGANPYAPLSRVKR